MKILQNTGMALVLLATVLLIGSLFLADYRLKYRYLEQYVPNEQLAYLKDPATSVIGDFYLSKFRFIQDLETMFEEANQAVKTEFGIRTEEIDSFLEEFSGGGAFNYHSQQWEGFYDSTNDKEAFKIQQLKSYTSWFDEQEFESVEALKEKLSPVVQSINNDLLNQKGFSSYQIKNLKMSLTKASSVGLVPTNRLLFFWLTIGLGIAGGLLYILPKLLAPPGIKNNHVFHSSNKNRGWVGITIGILLILFYVALYWFPEYITEWLVIADPLSFWIKNQEASQWFFYGLLYTLAIAVMGIRMLIHYRHSNYHIVRTISVIFFQVAFAFMIPEILIRLNQPSMDLKNIWPLDYDFFYDYNLENLLSSGILGLFMLVWGIALIVIAVPVFTYFYGKRWYCSWVCGCGGLAETMGDPYRHLSDKSLKAWKIERWLVHGILVFTVIMTIGVLYTFFTGSGSFIGINTYSLRSIYGFVIGAAFAGVIGVGFYPFMGNRVWCRFGCPLAAYIGLIQRFRSRFRITTNGGQCISCGNCSTYCEMGIDVRWYAQRGQNIIRASCVGCGICASVCPRGVLKLENEDPKGRFGKPILIGNDAVTVVN